MNLDQFQAEIANVPKIAKNRDFSSRISDHNSCTLPPLIAILCSFDSSVTGLSSDNRFSLCNRFPESLTQNTDRKLGQFQAKIDFFAL